MNFFLDRHQLLLKELLNAKVDFIIIGGYSVIYHGYRRTTGDVDIWIKPDNANKPKLLKALELCKIDKSALVQISEYDFTDYLAFSIWEKPERADFITKINLVQYDEADKQKIIADCEGIKVPFLHINHLVLSKINTGRLKDAADVEYLQKLQKLKKKK